VCQQRSNQNVRVRTFLRPWLTFPVGVIVLLVGAFLYVWLRVEPRLEYHSYGPYFYRQRVFMESFLGLPGGLANYAGVFLAQFNCQNWLGALVFVLSACVIFLAAFSCLARVSGRAPGFAALVPVFVLLLLRNHYGCPVAVMSVGLFLALAASVAHSLLPRHRPWLATAASGMGSGLLFYLAGLWPALVFGVLCCLFMGIQVRNWPSALSCLVLVLAGPLVAVGAGNVEIARLVNPLPEVVGWVLAAAFYASVPVGGAVLALLPSPAAGALVKPPSVLQERAGAAPWLGCWLQAAGSGSAVAILAFLLGWAAIWLTFDRRQKLLTKIDYHASHGQYEEVLSAASQVKVLNHPAKARLLLALYHTGRLAESLFSFHDMVEEAPSERTGEGFRAQSQTLFELGFINDAEHAAHEALELEGDRPDLLRLLARINLLKDRPQAAEVFLNVLSLIPFQGQPANEAWPTSDLRMPASDFVFLTGLRARMATTDVLHDSLPEARLLNVLLAANPTNRMAFEYLMAYHLLDLELKEVVEHLRLLDNFNYARIPTPYEEALLLFRQTAGARVELNGRTIRPETAERFRQFREAVRQSRGRAAGGEAIAASFGGTYWYYYYATRGRELAAGGRGSEP
jgi:hypothetical protein